MSRFSLLRICSVLLMSIGLMLISQNLFAAQVTLTWDAVSDSSLQGYKIYYGTASKNYATSIDVKNVTMYPVTGLSDGTTYYFAVTAYSSTAQSPFSGEVSFTTPQVCASFISPGSASFSALSGSGGVAVTAPAGCSCSSSTPPLWINVTSGATGTGNGTFNYSVVANTATTPRVAAVTIASQVFTVTQNGRKPSQ